MLSIFENTTNCDEENSSQVIFNAQHSCNVTFEPVLQNHTVMSRNNHHSLKLPTSFSSSLRCSPIHRESRASSERGLMALIPTRSTVSNSMHKSQRQTEQIRAFKCKLGQSCSSVPSSYATPETSPVEKQTGCCPLPSFTDTHMHQHGSTHLFYLSRSWSVQIQCVCRQSEELLLPPHRREQTAHCYRCTDKWKEGGVVSHEINKRGRQRRRSEASSIYNSILPSLHFSAMFLPPARSFLFLSSYLLLFYRQFFSSFPALLFLTLSVVLILRCLCCFWFILLLIVTLPLFLPPWSLIHGVVREGEKRDSERGQLGHLLEPASFTYSRSHKSRGTQRSERERNGRERGINLNAAGLGREGRAWHTHRIHQAGTSKASWRGHACSLGPGSTGDLALSARACRQKGNAYPNRFIHGSTKGIYMAEFTHKSTKPISSFTKQTGSIKMDNPIQTQRDNGMEGGTIRETLSQMHI